MVSYGALRAMVVFKTMNTAKRITGLALITVVLISAILSLLALSVLHGFSNNTQATQLDAVRIQHNQLHSAGVRYAALHLASSRRDVSPTATPVSELFLEMATGRIKVTIENEAGRIGLLHAEPRMLTKALTNLGVPSAEVDALVKRIQSSTSEQQSLSYRSLRKLLIPYPQLYSNLADMISLHNGQAAVNPLIASESVLALIPGLSNGEQQILLENRNRSRPSLVSSPIDNAFFTTKLSAFYRINTSVTFGNRIRSRTEIIKMTNATGELYQRVATL